MGGGPEAKIVTDGRLERMRGGARVALDDAIWDR